MMRIHTEHTLRYLNDSCLYAHSTYYLDNFHKHWVLLHVHKLNCQSYVCFHSARAAVFLLQHFQYITNSSLKEATNCP